VITTTPTNFREDTQHALSLQQLLDLACYTPTVGEISLSDSTTVDSIVSFEPGFCVLVQTFPLVYSFNVANCPTAYDGNAPHDSARKADNSLDETSNKVETVTLQNRFSASTNHHIRETSTYGLVGCGRLLWDISISAPFSSFAQVVANNPICGWTRDTLLGVTPQAGAACNTDNRLVGRNEHVVNTKFALLAPTWLPILLRYQPVDRGRPFHQAALTSSTVLGASCSLLMLLTSRIPGVLKNEQHCVKQS
jgi:hypothetical protein